MARPFDWGVMKKGIMRVECDTCQITCRIDTAGDDELE
jgi:hypothetical protein